MPRLKTPRRPKPRIEVPPERMLLTVAEACVLLSLGPTTVYGLVNDGVLRHRRVGRTIRIPRTEVEKFAKAKR